MTTILMPILAVWPRAFERSYHEWHECVEYTRFPIGQEPEVLTSVSEQCAGGDCEKYPFNRDDYPGQSIFCIHDCHQKRNQDRTISNASSL
jgi:hypothetical protein